MVNLRIHLIVEESVHPTWSSFGGGATHILSATEPFGILIANIVR